MRRRSPAANRRPGEHQRFRGAVVAARRVVALGVLALVAGPVAAGPARFDPTTRTLRLTYTFASLNPTDTGPDPELGRPQRPTVEQEAFVRALIQSTDPALSRITRGRLHLAALDYVDRVRDADLVISTSRRPLAGSYATRGGGEGRPGQILLDLAVLRAMRTVDAVSTVLHSLGHYVFGLADESVDGSPSGCPVLIGPGCLMDNWLTTGARHGWSGLCTGANHNPQPFARQSCLEHVDRFFAERGTLGTTAPGLGERRPTEVAAGVLAGRIEEQLKREGGDLGQFLVPSSLRRLARSQMARGGALTGGIQPLRPEEEAAVIDGAVTRVLLNLKPGRPKRFGEAFVSQLGARAEEAAREFARESEAVRYEKVHDGLLAAVEREPSLRTAGAEVELDPGERTYLEWLARAKAAATGGEGDFDRLYESTLRNIGLDTRMENLAGRTALAIELDIPGVDTTSVPDLNADRSLLPLPGASSRNAFGSRRCAVIAPLPLEPRDDAFWASDQVLDYADVRAQWFSAMDRLYVPGRGRLVFPDREPRQPPATPDDPFRRLKALSDTLQELTDSVRRERLESVVILVPPGGLPVDSLREAFAAFASSGRARPDLRVDLVRFGDGAVPPELLELVSRTGGSVSTSAGIDDIPSLAQRVLLEQGAGSWVTLPRKGTLLPPGARPLEEAGLSDQELRDRVKALAPLFARARAALARLDPLLVDVRRRCVDDPMPPIATAALLARIAALELSVSLEGLARDATAAPAPGDGKKRPGQQAGPPIAGIAAAKRALDSARFSFHEAADVRPPSAPARALAAAVSAAFADENLGHDLREVESLIRELERLAALGASRAGGILPVGLRSRPARHDVGHWLETRDRAGAGVGDGPAHTAAVLPLGRFFLAGETPDELSLVVGLSHRWPETKDPASGAYRVVPPDLRLYDDSGRLVEAGRRLRLDAAASSRRMLVFKGARGAPIDAGWYNAVLVPGPEATTSLPRQGIDFTFSVGASRPNLQLIVATTDSGTGVDREGTDRPHEGITVEVQLLVGRPVIHASVMAFSQESGPGRGPIQARMLSFVDDGVGCDRTQNDGVYTARFVNPPGERGGQILLSIEARPGDNALLLPTEVPGGDDRNRTVLQPAPKFQRATSLTVLLPR